MSRNRVPWKGQVAYVVAMLLGVFLIAALSSTILLGWGLEVALVAVLVLLVALVVPIELVRRARVPGEVDLGVLRRVGVRWTFSKPIIFGGSVVAWSLSLPRGYRIPLSGFVWPRLTVTPEIANELAPSHSIEEIVNSSRIAQLEVDLGSSRESWKLTQVRGVDRISGAVVLVAAFAIGVVPVIGLIALTASAAIIALVVLLPLAAALALEGASRMTRLRFRGGASSPILSRQGLTLGAQTYPWSRIWISALTAHRDRLKYELAFLSGGAASGLMTVELTSPHRPFAEFSSSISNDRAD
jgi:hypothetical protein